MLVFNQIYNIVGKYVEKFKPTYVKYEAIEDNRQKLYQMLIKRIQKELPIKLTPIDYDPESDSKVDNSKTFIFKMSY